MSEPTEADSAIRHNSDVWTLVTEAPLNLAEHIDFVSADQCGAIATFIGRVRDHDKGRGVSGLEYSSHPSASEVLAEIATEQLEQSEATKIAISHRVGSLEIGDDALVAAVSAPHRDVAFAAIEQLVEQAKARLPIWKKQGFDDGSAEWVNSP